MAISGSSIVGSIAKTRVAPGWPYRCDAPLSKNRAAPAATAAGRRKHPVPLKNRANDPARMIPSRDSGRTIFRERYPGSQSVGLDMVMGCFLLSAYKWLPENSHVIAGALAGGITGIIMREKKMSIETVGTGPLIIIFIMALVTLVTRWGGVWIMSFVPFNHRIKAFIQGMSGSVLVAILAPVALTGDKGAQMALLTTAVVMLVFKRPLISIPLGIVVSALVRYF